jgi:hypothetical protein
MFRLSYVISIYICNSGLDCCMKEDECLDCCMNGYASVDYCMKDYECLDCRMLFQYIKTLTLSFNILNKHFLSYTNLHYQNKLQLIKQCIPV